MGCCSEAQPQTKKPVKLAKKPRPQPQIVPTGIDLVQIDYPEEEQFDQDVGIDDIIQGLNWYAQFQIAQMKKRRKRDGHNQVFIEKLTSEVKQTQVCIYREFSKSTNGNQEEENMYEQFNRLSLQALCQLLGTFIPIAKLEKADSYLIGTEVKMMTVRGEKCMVRVGGGYADIKDYFNNYATKQSVSLYSRMNAQNQTFKQAVMDLLTKNGASSEVIQAYQVADDDSWQTANDLFVLLSNIVEEKTNDLARKSPKRIKKKGSQSMSVKKERSGTFGSKYENLSPIRGGQLL